ncbi:hypothetical protein Tco_1054471 [Tanacetum coccineum]|uniref:Ycf2 n=1 Tax=Tanacetum coccineum TaxID=301880 RepID=A0ABQ5GXV5_9ASTR
MDFNGGLKEEIEAEDLNWTGLHFTWIQSRLDPGNGILKKIDRVLGNSGFMGTFPSSIEETNVLKEYYEAVSDEEKFLYQQAKIDWLKDRDRNSKFFHVYLKSRRNRSRISMIQNKLGESYTDEKEQNFFLVMPVLFMAFHCGCGMNGLPMN